MAAGSAGAGTIQLRVDLQNAVQQLQRLNSSLQSVDNKASTTNKKLAGLSTSLQAHTRHLRDISTATQRAVRVQQEMSMSLHGVIGQLRNINQVLQQQNQLLLQNAQNTRQASQATQQYANSGSSAVSMIMQLAAAFGVTTSAIDIFKSSLNVTKELDSINKTFYAITGSMNGANMEMGYVREMAQGLGLDFMSLAKSYKGFSAATKFANMDLSTSKEIFESVAGASTVLGLSGEKTELVLMALEQMVSKGVVSMEELRRQLGDQLPGAFELGAKAMNMGLAEFNKFVASGKLMTEDFLPRFARTLKDTYATVENIGLAVKTPRAEIQKLQNELLFMQDTFARKGFLDVVIDGVRELTALLQTEQVRQNVIDLGRAFGTLVSAGISLVKFVAEHTTTIKNLLILYGAWKVASFALSGGLNTVANTLAFFNTALVGTGGRLEAFGKRSGDIANAMRNKWIAAISGIGGFLTGGLALGLSIVIPLLQEMNKQIDYSKEFADKFGVSVGEAEAQLATFLSAAGKTDAMVQLNKQFEDLNKRLREIAESAQIGFKGLMDRMRDTIGDMDLANQIQEQLFDDDSLTFQADMEKLNFIDKKSLDDQTKYVTDRLTHIYNFIQQGNLNNGKALAQYMATMKEQLLANAKDTESAWMPVFQNIEQVAVAMFNTIEQRQKVMLDMELTKVNDDWTKHVTLVDEVRVSMEKLGEVTKNIKIGQDLEADIKSFESVLSLVDKYYLKSEEGIREQAEITKTQIENADKIAEAWATAKKLKVKVEREMMNAEAERTKASIAKMEADITATWWWTDEKVQAVKAQITAYKTLLEAQNASVAALDASLAEIDKRVAEVKRKQKPALEAHQNETDKNIKKHGPVNLPGRGGKGGKGKKGGSGTANRDQSLLQSIVSETDKAQSALEALQDKYIELRSKLEGDNISAKIDKVISQTNKSVRQLDDSFAKLESRVVQMANGPQKEAAVKELANLKSIINEQKKQIDNNAEIEKQLIVRQGILDALNEQAEVARLAGDYTAYWAKKAEELNIELATMKEGDKGYAQKEYEAEMAQMKASNDLFGLASAQTNQWIYDLQANAQDTFANIIPNAMDSSIDAFSTLFTDILWGTKKSEDAWQAFTQAISNMGKQIINTLIQVAIKMMVVKMLSSVMGGVTGAADGAVVDSGGVKPAANGRVVSGARPRAFASGGVLMGPQLFQTTSGAPVLAGEAGPEAFVPLGRTREGKLGIETTGSGSVGGQKPVLVVNIFNNASDQVQTSQQESTDQQGNPRLDILIEQIDSAIGKRIGQGKSQIGRAIDKTRGTNPSKALYA